MKKKVKKKSEEKESKRPSEIQTPDAQRRMPNAQRPPSAYGRTE